MQESNQIIELLNNENTTFKNISYKSVNRTKLNNTNNNSFSNNRIRFNTKELSNHLVYYGDSYILLEVDIKFSKAANALPANIRLENSYEMVNSIKIELNRTIISNVDYVYYSNIIPHLLENSKSDDLLYRVNLFYSVLYLIKQTYMIRLLLVQIRFASRFFVAHHITVYTDRLVAFEVSF